MLLSYGQLVTAAGVPHVKVTVIMFIIELDARKTVSAIDFSSACIISNNCTDFLTVLTTDSSSGQTSA